MPSRQRIKCKFCNWTTNKWFTGRDGKKKPGWAKLREHILEEHEDTPEATLAAQNRSEGL